HWSNREPEMIDLRNRHGGHIGAGIAKRLNKHDGLAIRRHDRVKYTPRQKPGYLCSLVWCRDFAETHSGLADIVERRSLKVRAGHLVRRRTDELIEVLGIIRQT